MPSPVYRDTKDTRGDEGHLAFIYRTDAEHRALLTPFMRQGIEEREKVIYLSDTSSPASILEYLTSVGVDGHASQESGQLRILDARDTYLSKGRFDPHRMIALLQNETKTAHAEGYNAVRITGEMTWALRALPGSERLIEFEFMLNEAQMECRCLRLCQYDLRRFPPSVLLYVLSAHPVLLVGTKPVANKFYGIMPSYRGHGSASSTLHNWLSHLI